MSWPAAVIPFPYKDVAAKVALSAGIGLLVALEREWSHKEIGVRSGMRRDALGLALLPTRSMSRH